jgi:hypothetical protein
MQVGAFWEYVRHAQFRFYQERDVGLDLYHAGWSSTLTAVLFVAAAVVFLLSIFHVIPARRHVVGLLLGLGLAAALLGTGSTYFHWRSLPAGEERLIRETAGPRPANAQQQAAVVALPLVVGVATLALGCAGCVYMYFFWAVEPRKPAA